MDSTETKPSAFQLASAGSSGTNTANDVKTPTIPQGVKIKRNKATRNAIFRRFKIIGPDPELFHSFVSASTIAKHNRNDISKFIVDCARKSQSAASTTNAEIENLTKLCDKLTRNGGHELCGGEVPTALSTIATLEDHSVPSCSVDFRTLYTTLRHLMLGQPVMELNGSNQRLFRTVFNELMAAVQSEQGQRDKATLERLLNSISRSKREQQEPKDAKRMEKLEEIMGETQINRLQMPMEMLLARRVNENA